MVKFLSKMTWVKSQQSRQYFLTLSEKTEEKYNLLEIYTLY